MPEPVITPAAATLAAGPPAVAMLTAFGVNLGLSAARGQFDLTALGVPLLIAGWDRKKALRRAEELLAAERLGVGDEGRHAHPDQSGRLVGRGDGAFLHGLFAPRL